MLKCRMLEQRVQEIAAMRQQNLQKNIAGREAVLAGVLAHAKHDDSIAAAENGFLACFLRGDPLHSLLARFFSAATTTRNGKGSPAQLALAGGMGRANELIDSGKVVLVFCGEDPSALAFQYEALAFAAKYKVPLVCLIEISFSSLAAREDQHRAKSKKSAQHKFPEIVVDGADVVAIFRVAQEAVRRARTGHGPSLIQCVMPNESSTGSQSGLHENAHGPLAFMEHYLRQRNLWSEEQQRKIAGDFATELDAALASMEAPLTPTSGE
ncbi:MAG TPA: thiamine pyrophosphate-dependent enzyme [Candidatus Angelobacter sp.]|nr:thiamine pyrophosphate-dependent enzyme [Candidatus Angelobacter sp.]